MPQSARSSSRLEAIESHPLEVWRREQGLTKSGLASGLGVTRPFLYRLLSGEARASDALLRRIIDFTDGAVRADDMVLWTPPLEAA